MRVLCFTNMYPTNDEPWAGSFVRELVEGLRSLGTSVDVLAFDGRRRKRAYAEIVPLFRRILREEPFDLVHAHYGLTGAIAVAQRRLPVVVTFHGSDTRIPWQARLSWLAARLATPVFVSTDGARRLGCPNATVVPAGGAGLRARCREYAVSRYAWDAITPGWERTLEVAAGSPMSMQPAVPWADARPDRL